MDLKIFEKYRGFRSPSLIRLYKHSDNIIRKWFNINLKETCRMMIIHFDQVTHVTFSYKGKEKIVLYINQDYTHCEVAYRGLIINCSQYECNKKDCFTVRNVDTKRSTQFKIARGERKLGLLFHIEKILNENNWESL